MRKKLDSLQKDYRITAKEFEPVSPEKVKKAYKDFERLRGIPLK